MYIPDSHAQRNPCLRRKSLLCVGARMYRRASHAYICMCKNICIQVRIHIPIRRTCTTYTYVQGWSVVAARRGGLPRRTRHRRTRRRRGAGARSGRGGGGLAGQGSKSGSNSNKDRGVRVVVIVIIIIIMIIVVVIICSSRSRSRNSSSSSSSTSSGSSSSSSSSSSSNNRINQIRPTPLQWKASLGELAWPDRPGRARSRD